MIRIVAVMAAALFALATPALSVELVLPVFAHHLDGYGDTVWSSELYLTVRFLQVRSPDPPPALVS